MSGRPWLEALRSSIRESGADVDETQNKISEALPSAGCERCRSFADSPTRVVQNIQTTEKV